jgi:hypothetical protein
MRSPYSAHVLITFEEFPPHVGSTPCGGIIVRAVKSANRRQQLRASAWTAGLALTAALVAAASAEPLDAVGDDAGGVLIQMPFKRGDTVVVKTDAAEFYTHDRRLIARLERGTRVEIAKAAIAWVGGYVEHDGRRRLGWIRSGYLAKSLPEGEDGEGATDDAVSDDAASGTLPR